MMKKILLFVLLGTSNLVRAQEVSKIDIQVKPVDPKKGYTIELVKRNKEIKIYHKQVDSIAKFYFDQKDQFVMKRLLEKTAVYFDSLTQDSIAYFQQKIDSIRTANTYYKIDSATVYKSSHPAYWRHIETILSTPSSALEEKTSDGSPLEPLYCFFVLTQNSNKREVYIDSLDAKVYPLLTKLVRDTIGIMLAHKIVMERKNQ